MLKFECLCFAILVIDFLPFLLVDNAKAPVCNIFLSSTWCLTLIFVSDVGVLKVS